MNLDVLCILCATIVVPRDVSGFDLIREFLFPRFPTVTKVGNFAEARALEDEFAILHTAGLIERSGYPCEQHRVTTEDGYNINFFRIPGSSKSPPKNGKPVVLLQHGLLASSETWVVIGAEHDLAFLLADVGYDVWLSNIRGNSYGRSHTDLTPQDRDFWKFSYHEIATRDVSSIIDYALNVSGQETLIFVGHSMGTTLAFVLLSELPEYNEKVRLVIALAPIAFWTEPATPLFEYLKKRSLNVQQFIARNNIWDFGPQTTNNVRLGRALCSNHAITQPACIALYVILAGDATKLLNYTFLPHMLSYYPAGASSETILHYGQNLRTGGLSKFDFGFTGNFRIYGKRRPPFYDLKKISAPVALIYGKKDVVSTESNTAELVKRLQNVVTFEAVSFDAFNHLDFIWGNNAKEYLYNRIVELMSVYPE